MDKLIICVYLLALITGSSLQDTGVISTTFTPQQSNCQPNEYLTLSRSCLPCHCGDGCGCVDQYGCVEVTPGSNNCKRCRMGYTNLPLCQTVLVAPTLEFNNRSTGVISVEFDQSAYKGAGIDLSVAYFYLDCGYTTADNRAARLDLNDIKANAALTYVDKEVTFTPGIKYRCQTYLGLGPLNGDGDESFRSPTMVVIPCSGLVLPSNDQYTTVINTNKRDNSFSLEISYPPNIDTCYPEITIGSEVSVTVNNITQSTYNDLPSNSLITITLTYIDNKDYILPIRYVRTPGIVAEIIPAKNIQLIDEQPGIVRMKLNKANKTQQGTFDVTSYYIQYKERSPSLKWLTVPVDLYDTADCIIRNPGQLYEFRVKTETILKNGTKIVGISTDLPIDVITQECSDPTAPTDLRVEFDSTIKDEVSATVKFQASEANCNGDIHYKLRYRNRAGFVLMDYTCGTVNSCSHVTVFDPYSNYTIQIIASNQARKTKPSEYFNFKTPIKAPDSPSNIKTIDKAHRMIHISWEPPIKNHGPILEYNISIRNGTANFSIDESVDTRLYYDFMGYWAREYTVTIRARTEVDWGQSSPNTQFRVKPTIPGEVMKYVAMATNESCINSVWRKPIFDGGIIEKYVMSCVLLITYGNESIGHHRLTHEMYVTEQRQTKAEICYLLSGSQYNCTLSARNTAGDSRPQSEVVWTHPSKPHRISPPSIMKEKTTDTSVYLFLPRADKRDGPASYYVGILKLTVHSKRAIDLSGIAKPSSPLSVLRLIPPDARYVAYLTENMSGREFELGDGNTYGGYYNAPLETGAEYKIYYVVEITRGEKTAYTLVEVEDSVLVVEYTGPGSSFRMLIVAVSVSSVIILIVIIVAVTLVLRRKKNGGYFTRRPTLRAELIPLNRRNGNANRTSDADNNTWMADIRPIKLADLKSYVVTGRDQMLKEYGCLPVGFVSPYSAATQPVNREKNRFNNILPYDHTRVKLTIDNLYTSDYINANFIDGYKKERQYIACQGPNAETCADFWRMVWLNNVSIIVMMTKCVENGKVKCERYWPELNEAVTYKNYTVTNTSVEQWADFNVTTLNLAMGDNYITVRHFHFLSWPDHGVVSHSTPFLSFRIKIKTYCALDQQNPIVVHCSAGVGRSGTYIAIDYLLEQAREEGQINVYNCVQKLRTQRVSMVQTQDQYCYVYQAVSQALETNRYRRTAAEFQHEYPAWHLDGIAEAEFEALNDADNIDPNRTYEAGQDNLNKNQNHFILPNDKYRAFLMSQPKNYKSYINAVYVSSHRERNMFVCTQQPLQSTVDDYLRLLYDYQISTVVCLEPFNPDQSNKKFGQYLPDNVETILETDLFTVKLEDINDPLADISVLNVSLTYKLSKDENPTHRFRYFRTNFWKVEENVPENTEAYFTLLELITKWYQVSTGLHRSNICIQCKDGNERCGLFISIWNSLGWLKMEQEVDVYHAVEVARIIRPQFITNVDQYVYIFKLLNLYLQEFDLYANYK